MPGKLVFDASLILHLARVELLDLPKRMGSQPCLPEAVLRELEQGVRKDESPIIQSVTRLFQPLPTIAIPPQLDLPPLGPGEQEVLAYALQDRNYIPVLDDLYSRKVATRLGLTTTGVLGLLLDAHSAGLLPEIESTIRQMIASGAHFAPALVDQVIQAAKINIPST